MKYKELVSFDPIETVIVLREADEFEEAKRLVKSYVISDKMADQLTDMVFPHLQFRNPYDNKGLMVVGNYGTGKSHLMALITSLAEHEDLVECVNNSKVADNAGEIAGQFKVIRTEIGATTMSLRDVVLSELEKGLKKLRITYKFPSSDKATGTKKPILDMMAEFSEKYPEKGLLFALDELLDYLRTRKEQQLVLDLNFLRELGESCKSSRFRFMAGIQETLFENPRLKFVASSIRRVKARFQEVYISRQDIEYVISERLLKKDAGQKSVIRSHLERFTTLYGGLSEQMDRFVNLFPVHPAYIKTFERISFAEKREILKTFSTSISQILEDDVPKDTIGLLTYDSYWAFIKKDPSYKGIPEVGEVIEKSTKLENKLESLSPRTYRMIAIQLIHALSVHRLTTATIEDPIGVTSIELRDDLCVPFPPDIPITQRNEDFLKTSIDMIFGKILKTVSGQYISYNEDNGQYYLDLKKDVDYDELMKQKAETLSKNQLDRYYFNALARLMECIDSTYVPGFRIWEHELAWIDRGTTRRGYLFFGAPNQRSTAQPPRDFYLYFLPIFEDPKFTDEKKPDELFYQLATQPEDLVNNIMLYGGAMELASGAIKGPREVYLDKAEQSLKKVTKWLYKNAASVFDVSYQATSRKLIERALTFRELVNSVASKCLAPYFEEQSPGYPKFSFSLTESNRSEATHDALRYIGDGLKTKLGAAMLDGLELLDGEVIRPEKSRFAKNVLSMLRRKEKGQVLNRNELIDKVYGVEFETKFRLEPELLVVVLAALVRDGQIILSIVGKKFNPSNLDELVKAPLEDLVGFKHVEKPKVIPVGTLRVLFEILRLPPGLVQDTDALDDAVVKLQGKVGLFVNDLVSVQHKIKEGLMLWNTPLFSEAELEETKKDLDELKDFIESLQVYTTPGKLRNFRYDLKEVQNQQSRFKCLEETQDLVSLVDDASPLVNYLSTSEALLHGRHPWKDTLAEKKKALKLLDRDTLIQSGFKEGLLRDLEKLKDGYISEYVKLHNQARLNAIFDSMKARLVKDERLARLNQLANINLLPRTKLSDFQNRLVALRTCFSLIKQELEQSPICPHCNYRPIEEPIEIAASTILTKLDEELDTVNEEWERTLLDNLREPMVESNVSLLKKKEQDLIGDILATGKIPEKISNILIKALSEVFSGLDKVEIPRSKLIGDLTKGGMPCTVEEYRKRFEEHIENSTRGKDQSKIRIMIEEEETGS